MLGAGTARAAPPRVVVEVTPKAEKYLDARLTRRLIQLELSEVVIPGRLEDRFPSSTGTVFFRVLAPAAERLHVELWDRGDFHGARRVSGSGSAELRARRIALGAAELARRLRHKRIVQARQAEAERLAREQQLELERRELRLEGLVLDAEAYGGWLTEGGWLAGPRLGAELRLPSRSRVALTAAGLTGVWVDSTEHHAWRQLEVGIRAGQALRLGPRTELALSGQATAGTVQFLGATAVDEVAGQHTSWTSRAALGARVEHKVGQRAWLSAGPELGLMLRRVPMRDAAGEQHRVGGLMLGVNVGLALGL